MRITGDSWVLDDVGSDDNEIMKDASVILWLSDTT